VLDTSSLFFQSNHDCTATPVANTTPMQGVPATTPMDSVMATRHDPMSPFWDRSSVRTRLVCLPNTYPRRHRADPDMCVSATLVGTTIHCHRLHDRGVCHKTYDPEPGGKSIRWMRTHRRSLWSKPISGEVYQVQGPSMPRQGTVLGSPPDLTISQPHRKEAASSDRIKPDAWDSVIEASPDKCMEHGSEA
jgi:hypothetical protein